MVLRLSVLLVLVLIVFFGRGEVKAIELENEQEDYYTYNYESLPLFSDHLPGNDGGSNVTKVLDTLLKGYDRRLRPNYRGPPVEVDVNMWISSVSSISEVDMDYTLDIYFRQYWRDPRLSFNATDDELSLSSEMLSLIWIPDTFFVNAKKTSFHHATTKNAFLRISPNGAVFNSLRLTVTASCPMDLTYFPMDSQVCSLEIESFGYKTKDIIFRWHNPSGALVGIDSNVQLPQFVVKGHRETERIITLSTGNYSRLAVELYLVRSMGYYITHIYIPSVLIVVISWVSFWLHVDAVPARVALGITTILTMTTLISTTNASLPKISYLKSIDVYLVTCFIMVFASLLQYAAVNFLSKKPCFLSGKRRRKEEKIKLSPVGGCDCEKPKKSSPNGKTSPIWGDDENFVHTEVRIASMQRYQTQYQVLPSNSGLKKRELGSPRSPFGDKEDLTGMHCRCCVIKSIDLDHYARFVFPMGFVIFNILYWILYLIISQEGLEDEFILHQSTSS